MLLKLLPGQITDYWDVVKEAIERALPPIIGEGPNKMHNILEDLITGEVQCWAAFRPKPEGPEMVAIVLTTVVGDRRTETRSLLLYAICSFKKTQGSDWIEGFDALGKYAKKMNCVRFIAYTKEDNLIELAKKFGGNTDYHFITVPI